MLLFASSSTSSSVENLIIEATGPKICCNFRRGFEEGAPAKERVSSSGSSLADSRRDSQARARARGVTHLFADAFERRLAVGEHCRLDEEALVAPLFAAGRERRTLRDARLDIREDLVALLRRDQRAERGLFVERLWSIYTKGGSASV
jgi:hypothetical protein